MPSSLRRIENEQEHMGTILNGLSPSPRYLLGLFAAAVLASYSVEVIMALTGLFNAMLTNVLVNSLNIALLMVVNALGNKFNKIFAVNLLFGTLISCYMISLHLRIGFANDLAKWRLVITITSYFVLALLNAWLLKRYLKATGLK